MRKVLHSTWILLLALAVTLSLAACEEKKEETEKKEGTEEAAGEEAGAEEAGAEEAGAEEAGAEEAAGEETAEAAGPVVIEGLAIKANLPAGAEVSDMMGAKMIQAPGLVVTVEEAKEDTPADVAAAKEAADMYSPQNIQEVESPDGFILTWENEGSAGTNYWVQARREIGGKGYWCSTTASQAEQQANAVAFCKSLSQ